MGATAAWEMLLLQDEASRNSFSALVLLLQHVYDVMGCMVHDYSLHVGHVHGRLRNDCIYYPCLDLSYSSAKAGSVATVDF